MQTTITETKQAVRAATGVARDSIDPVVRLSLSEAVHGSLNDIEEYRAAQALGLYWAGGSEVSMTALTLEIGEIQQRRILLPFVLNGELCLTEWRPQDPVVDAEYGTMHPRYRRAVPLDEVDVILVPGLAFDKAGHRLGSGTGHYDRLLARMGGGTTRIGVCFSAQVVDSVPVETWDQPVDYIVTEHGVSICAREASLSG